MATADWFKRLVVPVADKIVYASNAYVGLKSTVNSLGDQLIDFTKPPTGPADERLHELARLVQPMTGTGLRLVRVGGDTDGGYVMADDFAASGAISVGVGPDVSWDQDIAARGITVALFDPTIRKMPAPVQNSRFFKVGIGGNDAPIGYNPLPQLVRMAGFGADDELILKVDVEGAEWDSLAALTADDLRRYRQMAFELHGLSALNDPVQADRVLGALRLLATHHVPIHAHANNYDDLVRFDDNWFPNAIEVSYLRKDLIVDPMPASTVSSPLDRPCDPRTADIPLDALARIAA